MSIDPSRKLAFVVVNQWGMSLKADSPKWVRGQLYTGERPTPFYMGDNDGHLKAIDIERRRIAWDWPSPLPLYGGSLATAGGLVFAGDGKGYLRAFDSRNGSVLWKFATGSGISAPPISYEIDGRQYIAVMSGIAGEMANYIEAPKGAAMLWVFGLGGSKTDESATGLPARKERKPRQPPPAASAAPVNAGHVATVVPPLANAADVAAGDKLFHSMCSVCHKLGGQGSDLATSLLPDSSFVRVMMAGKPGTTMAPWRSRVSPRDAQRILAYVKSTRVAQRSP
jgi:mono/diheme cytochrome c family protein